MTTWQKILAVIVIAALLVYGGCTLGEYRIMKRTSTVAEHDSITAFTVLPVPVLVIKDSVRYKVRTEHDTLDVPGESYPVEVPGPIVYLPAHTPQGIADDLNDYNITRAYTDTLRGKRDTASVSFSVKRNKAFDLSLKMLSHDSTKVIRPPKKFVLSFEPIVAGNFKRIGFGGGLDFKFPDDNGFSAGMIYMPGLPKGERTIYQVSKKFPIRLKLFPSLKTN